MSDITDPLEYTESDGAGVSDVETYFVDVRENNEGNNFREHEARVGSEGEYLEREPDQ